MQLRPIGIFDSGYGGLTILREIRRYLPDYDLMYLGDNARTPYGSRSFETVYHYTQQCVHWLFEQDCPLVILACNTASAKALRTLQQKDLPGSIYQNRNVLGVIRPTAEIVGEISQTGKIGVLATHGTVKSASYPIEIEKIFPELQVFQQACPLWVPLIENNEWQSEGAEYFIRKDVESLMAQSQDIDTVLLACTHYPILIRQIKKYLPGKVKVISQGAIVAESLRNYLEGHPERERECTKRGTLEFFTTDDKIDFDTHSAVFFGEKVKSKHIDL